MDHINPVSYTHLASRAYLLQVWAEAMTIYRSGKYSMKFSKSIQRQLVEVQKDFMPEDTEAGQIQGFLEHYTGSMVCSKQLFKEALGHTYDEPKRWHLHNINEIMNTVVTGWKPFSNPRMFAGYGRQKGWERDVSGNELPGNCLLYTSQMQEAEGVTEELKARDQLACCLLYTSRCV